jgi:cell division protein FtsZ
LDVKFEIITPQNNQKLFTITDEVSDLKVIDAEIIKAKSPVFEKPSEKLAPQVEKTVESILRFSLENEQINEIKVTDSVEFIPVTEVSENGVVRYSLEEYMDVEKELLASKPQAQVEKPIEKIDEELNITVKSEETNELAAAEVNKEVDPVEMTIDETLRMRAEERRKKMKDYNYKFHNASARIDEMEKVPAFKRAGLNLDQPNQQNNNSRMSLGTDSNDDLQIRSNNSFLHDNVD